MKDIYQQIWDADQNENGIQAILDHESGDVQKGYIKVNAAQDTSNPDFRVLTELHLPESKMKTYKMGLKLFDNYELREQDREINTPEERTEIHDFVNAIIDTAPMQVAREYIVRETGSSLSRERWYNTIMEMWFRQYSLSSKLDLSGFEHVIIGEQGGSKAKGYHFWYKYYLDDGFARLQDGKYADAFPGLRDDRISYLGTRARGDQLQYPETVTISYRWFAPDYKRESLRPLTKPTGGFFVGCSLEGLIALGTVRAHKGVNAPRKAVINGAEYSMVLYHGSSNKNIRTFFPKFIRGGMAVEPIPDPIPPITPPVIPPVSPHSIRIIAALVNPEGHDPSRETITLINTSAETVALNNWQIVDRNGNSSSFSATIKDGETHRIVLDGLGAQLSNSKDSTIKLLTQNGEMVHMVSYSRSQAREQGRTLLF